jgi:hypothetical protein
MHATLFDTAPAKRRPGYANFAVAEPPQQLVLLEGEPERDADGPPRDRAGEHRPRQRRH